MQIERGKKYLLWDGDCGFCARGVGYARHINDGDFVIVPYQSFPESELVRVGLSLRSCRREMKAVSAKGRAFGGAFALNYFLWHSGIWRALIALLHAFPILILVEVLLYRAVAENRGAISKLLSWTACSISERKETEK